MKSTDAMKEHKPHGSSASRRLKRKLAQKSFYSSMPVGCHKHRFACLKARGEFVYSAGAFKVSFLSLQKSIVTGSIDEPSSNLAEIVTLHSLPSLRAMDFFGAKGAFKRLVSCVVGSAGFSDENQFIGAAHQSFD